MSATARIKWSHVIDAAREIVDSYDTAVTLRQLFPSSAITVGCRLILQQRGAALHTTRVVDPSRAVTSSVAGEVRNRADMAVVQ